MSKNVDRRYLKKGILPMMIGKLKDLTMNMDGSQNVTITVGADFREDFDALKNGEVKVEIKKYTPGRSMDANSFFWHLCSEIAKRSSRFSDAGKNDIYKEAIRAKGEFDPMLVKEEAVNRFISRWSEKGTGWFADVIDDHSTPGYKLIHAYYGSSTYDTVSMGKILDYVILQANDLGIPTMTPKEQEKLLMLWGRRYEKKNGKQEEQS